MGYESKIYIVRKSEYFDWNEVIATFDLCKMGFEMYNGRTFRSLFTLPLGGDMYGDDGNTPITEDCYGDEVQGAEVADVLKWIKKFNKKNDYWRAEVFESLLESLASHEDNLYCYHYGY